MNTIHVFIKEEQCILARIFSTDSPANDWILEIFDYFESNTIHVFIKGK